MLPWQTKHLCFIYIIKFVEFKWQKIGQFGWHSKCNVRSFRFAVKKEICRFNEKSSYNYVPLIVHFWQGWFYGARNTRSSRPCVKILFIVHAQVLLIGTWAFGLRKFWWCRSLVGFVNTLPGGQKSRNSTMGVKRGVRSKSDLNFALKLLKTAL